MKKYYVYQHIREDKNEIFYIGIGTKSKQDLKYNSYSRASNIHYDNSIWLKIVAKTTWKFEILFESDNRKEVEQIEIDLIQKYGRKCDKTGCLSNLTLGGESNLGYKHTQEAIEKISEKAKLKRGYSNINFTPELRQRLSVIHKEIANRPDKIEYRRQLLKGNDFRSIEATLEDLETGSKWSANSIKELSKICPVAYSTLIRMKKQDPRCKLYNKYKLVTNGNTL
jgi:hypothetical protein